MSDTFSVYLSDTLVIPKRKGSDRTLGDRSLHTHRSGNSLDSLALAACTQSRLGIIGRFC
jgi:hypothetical protein